VAALAAWMPSAQPAAHDAVGKLVQLRIPANPRYPGKDGPAGLTNGLMGDTNFHGGDWLGFEGPDLEATVDLGQPLDIKTLGGDFLQVVGAGIFLPRQVNFAVSDDGKTFRPVATVKHKVSERESGPLLRRLVTDELGVRARYVHVHAVSVGHIPKWHRAGGRKAWLFVDEIMVNPKSELEAAFEALATYELGKLRRPLSFLEQQLREAPLQSERRAKLHRRLAGVLASDATLAGKHFVCRQLAALGTDEDVPALAAMLLDEKTSDMARFALVRLSSPSAIAALRSALPRARGKVSFGLINSLGELRDPKSVAALEPFLRSSDQAAAASAARALGKIGGPQAASLLSAAPVQDPAIADACLRCAQQLTASDSREARAKLYRTVYAGSPSKRLRTAALGALAEDGDRESLRLMVEILAGEDEELCRLAASFVRRTQSVETLDALTAEMPALPGETQVLLLNILADRGESRVLATMLEAGQSEHDQVRLAALRGLGQVGNASAVALLCRLLSSGSDQEQAVALESLTRLRGPDVDRAIVSTMEGKDASTRAALIRGLGRRRAANATPAVLSAANDADPSVRVEALKALAVLAQPDDVPKIIALLLRAEQRAERDEAANAIVAVSRRTPAAGQRSQAPLKALHNAQNAKVKALLLSVLGRIADEGAQEALIAAIGDDNHGVQAAAIRSLSRWPTDAPIDALIGAARSARGVKEQILATRACIDLARSRQAQRKPGDTLAILAKAMNAASRNDEKKMILGAASSLATLDALAFVEGHLADVAIRQEACAAAIAVADAAGHTDPGRATAALDRVMKLASGDDARRRAKQIRDEILMWPTDAPTRARMRTAAWQPLFDGKSLQGWQIIRGGAHAWSAGNGVLTANKGSSGWIATTKEYADFQIEFDFRLPPGGNSGLFLRAPREGNPAFAGMEVQILDDYAPQYAKLQPAQYCASVYSIAGADPRVSKRSGEWQKMTVLCAGRRVVVNLDGTRVAAADLDQHLGKAERIPGIKRTKGLIGLQNEHGPIEFRNVRIKDLVERPRPQ